MTGEEMERELSAVRAEIADLRAAVKWLRVWVVGVGLAGLALSAVRLLLDASREKVPPAAGNHNSVRIGAAGSAAEGIREEGEGTRREWLTTEEVAAREGVAVRTVLDWIRAEGIAPAPERDRGGRWQIAADYRIPRRGAEGRQGP